MTTPSNLYAEKIFAEHPISMWALDDAVDYISLIDELDRDLVSWTVTNGSVTSDTIVNEPFPNSITSLIIGDIPAVSSETTTCISQDIINFLDLDQDLKTFSINTYFYAVTPFISAVSIGYEYTDPSSLQIVQNLERFVLSSFDEWAFISATFNYPNIDADLRMVVQFEKAADGTGTDYYLYINGLSLGQWSEDFASQSLGATPIALPPNIPLTTNNCVPADPYGLGGLSGYYLVDDNSLKARNTAMPMVYGASNVTRLRPNGIEPSLIIPGNGFLNQDGQYKDYTVEFWIRVGSNTTLPKRIFGPIASTDGLYIEGAFLTFVIGDKFASHFVGEWFRPMLISIRMIKNSASLLINGDEVITLNINTDNLVLPPINNEYGDNQDWLGFYCYEDVSPIELDCVAIYPYSVSNLVAKRRWVYGQGVVSPENINSSFGGTQAFIDYTFADYTSNYVYPDFAGWDQGTFDNLVISETSLKTPEYSLPEISTGNKTLQDLYSDNKTIQDINDNSFITFRPNTSWVSINSYFNFNRFNIINNEIRAIYGVFSSDDLLTEETLFKIYNPITGNNFSIRKDLDEIHYYLTYNGIEQEIYTTDIIVENEKYAAGIDIQMLSSYFGGNVAAFFGNQSALKMYVGGDDSGSYQFTGKIYSVGLSTPYNTSQIQECFDSNGTVILDSYLATGSEESANAIALLNHTASYTILPTEAYDTYYLDIGVAGYWEDYLPLSYFGQFVKNQDGQTYYDLDFLQFNIGYPKPSEYVNTNTNPPQEIYDTEGASIKSYITLQYVDEGANASQSYFTSIEPAYKDGIINIKNYQNWQTTKFEVVDNTLIYPDKTIDFNKLAIVYHLDFNVRGIFAKPISLRKLELASQAFNANSFNPIGTRFGIQMFPFTRSGLYYDYKAQNPFSIYKGSTPYLYLNRTSGIEVRGEYDPLVSRGISIPINQTLATDYAVSAFQVWMRSDLNQFSLNEIVLFEIRSLDYTIQFIMQGLDSDGSRAKIFAVNADTGQPFNSLNYYIDGILVKDPIITIKEWASLGISFTENLRFASFLGSINLIGPVVFNNIAFYQANNLQQVQSTVTRPWLRVKTDGITEFDWDYWRNIANSSWERVLYISSSVAIYGTNPADVYKAYLGTNKFIIDDNEGLTINPDNLNIYSNISWSSSVATPV